VSNYRWRDRVNLPLGARYLAAPPGDVAGLAEWELFLNQFPYQNPADAWDRLRRIHRAAPPKRTRKCPRVFISHRHGDEARALRIAWLAHCRGFEYWLDVIDIPPSLIVPPNISTINTAILIAAFIEMALINSTHVIAVLTRKTSGSQWVPYEYGRIKDDPPGDLTAACWHDTTSLPAGDLPEYVHLAPVLTDEPGIQKWIDDELLNFPYCRGGSEERWTGDEPEPLP
jgi:hypothetical protein